MNKLKIFFLTFIFATGLQKPALSAADSFLFGQEEDVNITINNCILAQINGNPITVLDVVKKMDMLFLKQFPEYTSAPQARYQFYQVNWKTILQELIDKELILADAQESKLPISSGDVRQEMEKLFGPNIIGNLDKIGLSFEEVFKIIEGDIKIRRMMGARVNSKVVRAITPQALKQAYEEFSQKNLKKETWHYQVASIRNNDPKAANETAEACYTWLNQEKAALADLPKLVKERLPNLKSSVNISDEQFHTLEEIAKPLFNILKEMASETVSKPVAQKSRTDRSMVIRIIYLKEKVPGGTIPFKEIENQLKDFLYEQASEKESKAYLQKLRQSHGIDDQFFNGLISTDFQPFELK